jgi:phenylalanyl-tRNA synthetase beta chain
MAMTRLKQLNQKKFRNKPTLNKSQKLFHFLQRAVASKGYLEAITWSFSDSKVNELFYKNKNQLKIINPISADLNALRNSIFSNLIIYLNKNINRGFKDVALFEIGPIFNGTKPGEQETVLTGLKAGKISRSSWLEKSRNVDVFDVKRDVIQTIVEAGYHRSKLYIDDQAPDYYHPGKSGRIFLNKGKENLAAYFGEIHPNILKKIDIKTEALMGFEIFLDNLKVTKKSLKEQKPKYETSDFQKSERDFAFIVDRNIEAQEILEVINNIDKELIKSSNIFDVYEGENIPNDKKSVAVNLTIQSSDKTLNDDDLDRINKLVIETVEKKIGA